MSQYRVMSDGSIACPTIEEALAVRDRLLGDSQPELERLRAFAAACKEAVPGAELDDIPPLIQQLRTAPPDAAMTISMRYWKARAESLAEERDRLLRSASDEPKPKAAVFDAGVPPRALDPAVRAPAEKALFEDAARRSWVDTALPAALPEGARLLRDARKRLGWPQASMAARLKLSTTTLAQMESGKRDVPESICAAARELLLADEPEPATTPPRPAGPGDF